jgi:hypothetical protein
MELNPEKVHIAQKDTHRLIRSRYPPVGILDLVARPSDLRAITELEGWTNDRISSELGLIQNIPEDEWALGVPNANAIMAAFCHPHPRGGRFSDNTRGAWYAGFSIETAFRETIHHLTAELDEIGVFDTFVDMREYLSDFDADFHDLRPSPDFDGCHDPDDYSQGQALGRELLDRGSNGVIYRSVRDAGAHCLACFRPKQILNVRQARHFRYTWAGRPHPHITELGAQP